MPLLSRLYNVIVDRTREWRIRDVVRELRRTEPSRATILPLVVRLRDAWGNTGWSADLGFLEAVVVEGLESSGPFLECGAGLSTVILGVIAERKGAVVWSLEQDERWSLAMRARLVALGLGNVHIVYAPLEIKDGAAWYAFDDSSMPRAFPTIFCDGPSVRRSQWPEAVYRGWRTPLVAELRRRGISFGSIVLDDADDRRCGALIDAWRHEGLLADRVETQFGPHVVARQPLVEPTTRDVPS